MQLIQTNYSILFRPVCFTCFFFTDKPSPPRNLTVHDVWSDYIGFTWEAPESDGGSALTGYTIEQRDTYDIGYRFLASVDANCTSYQATNLQEGHDYYFRVFAQNAAGLSEKPAEVKPAVTAKLPFGTTQRACTGVADWHFINL